jgi:hypothetical protein
MNEAQIRVAAHGLVERSGIAFLGAIGGDGGPEIETVQVADREGLGAVWISTDTSSENGCGRTLARSPARYAADDPDYTPLRFVPSWGSTGSSV